MTRINLISVLELSDQHLFAEYRELPRLASFAKKTIKKYTDIPNKYTMGPGHMTFFLNKASFLEKRHMEIVNECLNRKINISNKEPFVMERIFKQINWKPSEEEIKISRNRIEEKLKLKPKFYTWYRKYENS